MSSTHPVTQKRILVVDDDESILDAIELLLTESDYKVYIAQNEVTLSRMLKSKPDLILLDIWMSGINGSDVCIKLKKEKLTRTIPVVLFSANKDIKAIAKAAGADAYISKPFQINDLLKIVRRELN